MPPHLRRRPDGRYYIDEHRNGLRVKIPVQDSTGRPVRDEAVAARILEAYAAARDDAGHAEADPDPTLRAALSYYRDSYLVARNAAHKTRLAADLHIDTFLRWAARQNIGRVSQLSTAKLDAYTADLLRDHAPNTAKNHIATIRAALNAAVHAEVIPAPRVRYTIPKGEPAENRPLSIDELHALLEVFRNRWPGYNEIVEWMAATGNRPSDACTLTPDRVDLVSATVDRVSVKVRALRKYTITPYAVAVVRQALTRYPGHGPLFRTAKGVPWTVNKLHHDFVATVRAARFPRHVTPYDLRHTFCTLMANDYGCPITDLRVLAGHSSILVTSRYIRASAARPALEAFGKALNNTPVTVPDRPQKPK